MRKLFSNILLSAAILISSQAFAGAQGEGLKAFLTNFTGRWNGTGDVTIYSNPVRNDFYSALVYFDARSESSWDLTSHLSGSFSSTTVTSFRVSGDDLLVRAQGNVEQRVIVQSVDASLLRFSMRRYDSSTGRFYDLKMYYGFNAQGGFFAQTQAFDFGRLVMEDQIHLDRF